MATRKRTGQETEQLNSAKVVNRMIGTIGTMTDQLVKLREKKKALTDQADLVAAEYAQVEAELIERLEAEGSSKGSGTLATCSISVATVANVTDWAAVEAYVHKTKHYHLFQRRLSDPAWRELFEAKGKPIPGTEPFSKKKLTVRSI